MKSTFASSAAWTQRYEELRHHVLSPRPILSVDPMGLRVLREDGVAGWMHRWPDAQDWADSSPVGSVWALSLQLSPEPHLLTVLLAQMTSQHLCPPSPL